MALAPPEMGLVTALASSSARHAPKFSNRALWQEAHQPLGGPQGSRQQGPNVARAATSWGAGLGWGPSLSRGAWKHLHTEESELRLFSSFRLVERHVLFSNPSPNPFC